MSNKMSKRQQYDTLRQQAFDMGLQRKGFGKKPMGFYEDIISGKTAIPQQAVKLTKTGKIRKQSNKPISQERKQAIKEALGEYSMFRNKAKEYDLLKTGEGKKSKDFYKNLVDQYEGKIITKQVFNDVVVDGTINLNEENMTDMYVVEKKYSPLIKLFMNRIIKNNNLNFQMVIQVEMTSLKLTEENEELKTMTHYFSVKNIKLIKNQFNLIESTIENMFNEIRTRIEEFSQRGSEWVLSKILSIELKSTQFRSVMGSSYFKCSAISHKAFLNIRNEDEKCFLWCLTAFFHTTTKDHPERVSHYKEYINEWNLNGIHMPMKLDQISKFIKLNSQKLEGKGINVFGLDSKKKDLVPIRIENDCYNSIDLLLIENGEGNNHYVLIKDINSFGSIDKNNKTYICKRCLCYRTRDIALLNKHNELCSNNEATRVVLPQKGENDILKFNSYQKMLPCEFIIVYDFETHFKSVSEEQSELIKTKKINEHVPNSCFLKTICFSDSKYNAEKLICNFENPKEVITEVINYFLSEEERISVIKRNIVPIKLSKKQEQSFINNNICHICNEIIPKYSAELPRTMWKVRDHNHVTGEFRGPAHSICNVNYRKSQFIPCIAHNSKNYDSHLFIKELARYIPENYSLTCIPNNEEKYISFSLKTSKGEQENYIFHELRFLDSLNFLSSSLDNLAKGLKEEDFVFLKEGFGSNNEQYEMAKRKGFYPYEYMDENISEKMKENCLPPIEAFSSKLYGGQIGNNNEFSEDMSSEQYELAQQAWSVFNCSTLYDYHQMYLKIDVLLLCDIIMAFRKLGLNSYKLDPMNYYTLPAFSWDALLFYSKVELELLTDIEMVQCFEAGTRGGISMVKHRYAKSNTSSEVENKQYLRYWDSNNLYGWAMSQYLPISNFNWSTNTFTQESIMQISDESEKGYLFDVDIEVPKDHVQQDYLKDYPLLAEHVVVKNDMLSEYQLSFNQKQDTVKKLCLTLKNKMNYIIHYRNLKQAISLGYKLKNINRVLEFIQAPWMKSYIELNTNFRKEAVTDFERDFYKLMNNSVFGKTMENIRNRINFTLINNEERLMRFTNKINYKNHVVFDYDNETEIGLIGVHMHKNTVVMNKPIYVGTCVLELSKVLMYDFHYNFIKKNFGDKATLLFTDTDSLCYSIKSTEEQFINSQKENINWFDNSAYSKDHLLYNSENKKVIGKFKDECNGIEMQEFCGLRSKLYSFTVENEDHCKAKGVKKCVTNHLKLNDYKDCLFNRNPLNVKLRTFRSYKHKIYTIESTKQALSAFDNKNYILPDGIETLPFGHYLTVN